MKRKLSRLAKWREGGGCFSSRWSNQRARLIVSTGLLARRSTNTRKTSKRYFVIIPTEPTQCKLCHNSSPPFSLSSLSLPLSLSALGTQGETCNVCKYSIRTESLKVTTWGVYLAAWANKRFSRVWRFRRGALALSRERVRAILSPLEFPCKLSGNRNHAAFRLLLCCLPEHARARFSHAIQLKTGFEERSRTFDSTE